MLPPTPPDPSVMHLMDALNLRASIKCIASRRRDDHDTTSPRCVMQKLSPPIPPAGLSALIASRRRYNHDNSNNNNTLMMPVHNQHLHNNVKYYPDLISP